MLDPESLARQQRAAARRASWKGGPVAMADAEAADLDFWQTADGGVRLQAIWELAAEQHGLTDASPPGLSRSPGGVRRR